MFENVLLSQTKALLLKLRPDNFPPDTYLAGGTAIALQLGHRRSADLDFFTPNEFEEIQWEEKLKKDLGFKLAKRDWQTLIGYIDNIKLSLFFYKYNQVNPFELYQEIPVASLSDLAAMKLETILGRGTKRDVIDLYFLAQQFTLKDLLAFYQEKYGNLEERELMIKKALVYFDEADKDERPDMLIQIEWTEVKKWFLKEVREV